MTFTNRIGFDVSKYQGAINFATMRAYGAEFVILRCGYGATTDERFVEYMRTAPVSFSALSVYHYYDPLVAPTTQANKVTATLYPYRAQIRRVWLDLEYTWTGSYTDPAHWLTYRNAIEAAGYLTGIYTRKSWWDGRVGAFAAEFAKRPLWAAQYNTELNLIPKGWTEAHIWQKGTPAIGLAVGVSSLEVDLDIWNDDKDFAAEWGAPVPPPTGGTLNKYRVNNAAGLNLRPATGTNNTPIMNVPNNSFLWGEDLGNDWLKLSHYQKPTDQYATALVCYAYRPYTALVAYADPPLKPAVVTLESVSINLAPGSTVTHKYSDGSQRVETA